MIFRIALSRVRVDETLIELEAEDRREALRLAKERARNDDALWVPLSTEIVAPGDEE